MKVIMYTSNFCPYCTNAEKLLNKKGLNDIKKIFIDKSEDDLLQMIEITGRRTVPQIFINDQHIGGFDDLRKFDQSGELDKVISDSKI